MGVFILLTPVFVWGGGGGVASMHVLCALAKLLLHARSREEELIVATWVRAHPCGAFALVIFLAVRSLAVLGRPPAATTRCDSPRSRGEEEPGVVVVVGDGDRQRALLEKLLLATWLILPVVICLSQRLSHACLSISLNMVKPRMAH